MKEMEDHPDVMITEFSDCQELALDLNKKLISMGADAIYVLLGEEGDDVVALEQIKYGLNFTLNTFAGTIQSTYNCLVAMHSMISSYPLNKTLNKIGE